MTDLSDLVETTLKFAQSMQRGKKNCTNCWHSKDGYCAIQSCNCATDVWRRVATPCWWTSYEQGAANERSVLMGNGF